MNVVDELQYLILDNESISNNKIIKKIEQLVRSSKEYKAWCSYIWCKQDNVESYMCNETYFDDKTIDDYVQQEIHHCILTLWDIIKIVMLKYNYTDTTTIFDIVSEVLNIHMSDCVFTAIVDTTTHNFIHNGSITLLDSEIRIPSKVNEFLDKYTSVMSDNNIEQITRLQEVYNG